MGVVIPDGFDHRKGVLSQLQGILNVSSDEFVEIKTTISRLVSTMLDINRQSRNQQEELSGIEDKLRMHFPTVFDSTQKLGFARQLAMQYLRRRRNILSCANKRRFRAELGKQVSQPSRLTIIPWRPSDPRYSGPTNQIEGPPPHCCQNPRIRDTGIGEPSRLSFSGQSDRSRSIATATNPSPCTPDSTRSISYIHHFLQGCSPPLDHFLSRFFELGFRTQDTLREVAHVWTKEERRELMMRLAPGLDGKKITELELVALERAFQTIRSTVHQ